MPAVTVGLPLYGSHWAWIALESLCRQQCACEWELIACEEQTHDAFGLKGLKAYNQRLREAGCARMKYLPIPEWINLGQKWTKIAEAAAPNSKMFFFQDSDDYSHPKILTLAYNAIKEDRDWIWQNKGVFFNLKTKRLLLYQNDTPEQPGINVCIRTDFLRYVKTDPEQRLGFKHSIWLETKKRKSEMCIAVNDEGWDGGVFTDGYNRISTTRGDMYECPRPPFEPLDGDIRSFIPADIAAKMMKLVSA